MSIPWDLLFQIGEFFIKLFVRNYEKRQGLIDNFNAWLSEMQSRSNMSIDARESYEKQMEELKKKGNE